MKASGSKKLVILLVLLIAGGAFVIGANEGWIPSFSKTQAKLEQASPKKMDFRVPVITAKAESKADNIVIQAIGTARAAKSVILFTEADGEVTSLNVKAGQQVKKGDVILQLDNRNARLDVELARTHVNDAKIELERMRALKKANIRAGSNLENAQIAYRRAELELSQAEVALNDRVLKSPFDGIVGIPFIEVGDRVTTTTQIVTLDDRSQLQVEFEIAERYFPRLYDQMPIFGQTPSFPDKLISGQITEIDSRIDPVARTVRIRATFDNPDDLLRPGMSLGVILHLEGPSMSAVPEISVQWRDGKSYVWRINEGKAERVDVQTRRRLNQTVLVEGPLKPGDQIVVEGVQRLRPGVAVQQVENPES
ncbi:efflux RND transporter periplasmic adaptor subunit [Sneathiella limimaris]|uniref:efflux RND transporter periplasmic adaptor subunit n=1 Tax=Sneathiella limimaris TaxID=1964213 RepID=UPI00146E1747|nr:efflux RND transporter periplasmic adaptor subunit [Sneathiella limimaris]